MSGEVGKTRELCSQGRGKVGGGGQPEGRDKKRERHSRLRGGQCKVPDAERSGKHWRLAGVDVQQRSDHTQLWGQNEGAQLNLKVPELRGGILGRERQEGARIRYIF